MKSFPSFESQRWSHLWGRWASICIASTLNSSGAWDTRCCDHSSSSQAGEYLPLINLTLREASGHKNRLVSCEVFISALNLHKLLHPSTRAEGSHHRPSFLYSSLSCFSFSPRVDCKSFAPWNTKTDIFVKEPEWRDTYAELYKWKTFWLLEEIRFYISTLAMPLHWKFWFFVTLI